MVNKTTSSSKKPSKKRIILFKGISIILVPLLILFLVESGLRIFKYGNNLSLFIDYKGDKNYLVFNPDASKKYFIDQQIATKGNNEIFKKKKGDSTIRIFILGESTTIGYPYFHNGSFHRWLQYRLSHTYPNKNFEVINLSLTAVNSYTVLGFAKEVVNYEPDAVLIYTGHNEYYGALGAASTQTLGSNSGVINFIISLRDLRLSQLIINIYENLQKSLGSQNSRSGGDRMQLMVAKQEIPFHSDLYEKGVVQFRNNMEAIMDLFGKRHIPLFVSNLVSNEKDLKPFISFEPDSLKLSKFKTNLKLGEKALADKDLNSALAYLKKADQLYSSSALCNFYLGQLTYKSSDFAHAKKYFLKAKELDGLRFRAPEEFNEILLSVADKYPNTHLVDTKAAFENNADHYIIGNELIVDHVHPDLKGYAIMSDVFYEAIKKYHVVPESTGNDLTFKQLLKKMPQDVVDSLAGNFRVLNLKKRWPYNDPHAMDAIKIESKEDTLAYMLVFKNIAWNNIMDNLYGYYLNNNELLKARNVLENLSLEYPQDADLYERIAMLSGELKDDENTAFYFKKSFNLAPTFNKARYLFVTYLKMDKPADAITYINYAISNNSSGFNIDPVKSNTEQIIQLQQPYLSDTTNVPVLLRIATLWSRMGNKDGEIKYAQKILRIDPKNKMALSMVTQSKNAQSK